MHSVLVVLAAFAASAVEMVEALTIVLAVAVTRGWRSTALGVVAAIGALTLTVAALGPALTEVPIDTLRYVVGVVLLIFGLQWLRKAILRAAGVIPLHDEDAIFRAEVEHARHARRAGDPRHDWYAFTVAFKGVFLEGLEVVFIVLTIGSTQGSVALAAIGAVGALIAVVVVGSIVHAPLSRVPENTLKFGVGVMLTAFGVFWCGEGAGVSYPGGDAALLVLVAFVALLSFGLTARARGSSRRALGTERA